MGNNGLETEKKRKRLITVAVLAALAGILFMYVLFMLASTFLVKEPVTVITPSSVSEINKPNSNVAQVLVSPNGKVFLSITGEADPKARGEDKEGNPLTKFVDGPRKGQEITDGAWSTDSTRVWVLKTAVAEWNKLPKNKNKQVTLTDKQIQTFSKINVFGVPFEQLPAFLDLAPDKQDKFMADMESPNVGIPIDIKTVDEYNNRDYNEFMIWMRAIEQSGNDNLKKAIKSGEGIAVKADGKTPYEPMNAVLENLRTLKMNKFSIMTTLKPKQD